MSKILPILAAAVLAIPASAKDDGALQLLPAGIAAVVHLDVARMRKSGLYQTVHTFLSANPEFAKAKVKGIEEYGFDFDKDLAGLTIGVDGTSGHPVIVVSGNFDEKKLKAAAAKEKAKSAKHAGVTYWYGQGKDALALVDGRLVIGKEKQVKAALDARKGKKRLKKGAPALKLAKQTETGKDIWAVFHITPKFQKNMNRENAGVQLASARGHIDLEKGLTLRATATAKDKKSAATMVSQLEASKKQANQNPGFAAMGLTQLLAKVTASAKGNDVEFKVDWDEADMNRLKALMAMAGAMMGAAQQPRPAEPPAAQPTPAAQPAPAPPAKKQ